MNIGVIGLGLIGGSMALELKQKGCHVLGYDKSSQNEQIAMEKGIVSNLMPIEKLVRRVDIIVVSIPVSCISSTIRHVLDISKHQTIIETGSTKFNIVNDLKAHPKREHVVATHPMAGTEFSGPSSAKAGLFKGKVTIICDRQHSSEKALEDARKIYTTLEMKLIEMDAKEHDLSVAFISHLSHITSFSLSLAVLEKEKNYNNILNLASGGFSSTVRLAKSSPQMWTPIFLQNKANVLDAIDIYLNKLKSFRESIASNDVQDIESKIKKANEIKKINL